MGEDAVRLASAVGYVNAGTVEFMLDAEGEFYFLEMNTRLQVEHGVTELQTGLDLVALQLSVAAGDPLPFRQDEIGFSGHSIECRVYAEDPQKNYLPSPGRITRMRLPQGEGVRNDVGTYEGDEISTFYDPMISKLLTHGANRIEAIERMERALSDFVVEGVKTNLILLRTLITHPVFRAGQVTTDFLDTQLTPEALAEQPAVETLLAALGYLVLDSHQADPWRAAGPTGAGGVARVDLEWNGKSHTRPRVAVAGRPLHLAGGRGWQTTTTRVSRSPPATTSSSSTTARPCRTASASRGKASKSRRGDRIYRFAWSKGERHKVMSEGTRQNALTAPMHGLVLKVLAKPGDHVRAHQTLVVIEAMKMEHSIQATHDGVVKAVHCKEGGRVTEGELLIEVEPEGAVVNWPERVTITEVGPRDGLQNESRIISLDDKVRLIDALSRTGLKRIEAASFVSPEGDPADGRRRRGDGPHPARARRHLHRPRPERARRRERHRRRRSTRSRSSSRRARRTTTPT